MSDISLPGPVPFQSWVSHLRQLFLDTVDSVPVSPSSTIYLLGVSLGAAGFLQAVIDPEPLGVSIIEIGAPVALSLAVLYVGATVTRSPRAAEQTASVLGMSFALMVIASGTVVLIWATQTLGGDPGFDVSFGVVLAASTGAAVGGPVGLYHDEVIEKRDSLSREVERTQELNQRMQVLHRVLRHNVRTQLNIALGHCEDVHEALDDDLAERLQITQGALERLLQHTEKSLRIRSLLDENVSVEEIDVVGVVQQTLETRDATRRPGVEVRSDLPETAHVAAHPLVTVAISEAIDNAFQHNSLDDLLVRVEVSVADDWVELAVADDGRGMSSYEREILSLERETPLRHSQGVGLWLMKWSVDASGGGLHVSDNDPRGTVVRMRLPRAGRSDDG